MVSPLIKSKGELIFISFFKFAGSLSKSAFRVKDFPLPLSPTRAVELFISNAISTKTSFLFSNFN